MSVRAYGKSIVDYTGWVALTSYSLNDYVVPSTSNGKCYRCTTAGTSGETEPTWNPVVGATVNDGGIVWTCEEYAAAPNPLSVTLDAKGQGGSPHKDIWVKSTSGTGDFIVYGSYDGVNWRQIDEITVPVAGRDNRYKGLQNAYPFIKVSTSDELAAKINEIEIVAG